MKDVLLRVLPAGDGWRLDCSGELEPLLFCTGAKAEAQAHALARGLSRAGSDARVMIHDRARQLVGSTRYFAQDA